MKKWFAVMNDRDDNDWGTGSFDQDEAQRMIINRLDIYPDAYIAVIDDDDAFCVDEIEQDDFSAPYDNLARIVKAQGWDEVVDDLKDLAYWADMEDEWAAADGDNAEDVIRKMGEKYGIKLG